MSLRDYFFFFAFLISMPKCFSERSRKIVAVTSSMAPIMGKASGRGEGKRRYAKDPKPRRPYKNDFISA